MLSTEDSSPHNEIVSQSHMWHWIFGKYIELINIMRKQSGALPQNNCRQIIWFNHLQADC